MQLFEIFEQLPFGMLLRIPEGKSHKFDFRGLNITSQHET